MCSGTPFTVEKISPIAGLQLGTGRSHSAVIGIRSSVRSLTCSDFSLFYVFQRKDFTDCIKGKYNVYVYPRCIKDNVRSFTFYMTDNSV